MEFACQAVCCGSQRRALGKRVLWEGARGLGWQQGKWEISSPGHRHCQHLVPAWVYGESKSQGQWRHLEMMKSVIALWCARSWSFTKIRPHVSDLCLQQTAFLPLCFVIVVHHVYTWGWSEIGVMSLNFLPHRLWVDTIQVRSFYNYIKEKTYECAGKK